MVNTRSQTQTTKQTLCKQKNNENIAELVYIYFPNKLDGGSISNYLNLYKAKIYRLLYNHTVFNQQPLILPLGVIAVISLLMNDKGRLQNGKITPSTRVKFVY